MNKRIKELEIQCWEPRQYGPAWFNSTKFAELIVRECLLELADVRLEHVFDPETDKLFVIAIDRIKTFRS